ncbi:hypothetical protein DID80_07595 [Candidatus Marinamargulisbacteria bacterium SCGC AAA071-K20]|nr:hypothetical protein DID80_07595 [Candidatus Marinamargulisbacteria bacterium SCGC AAA071-K20]
MVNKKIVAMPPPVLRDFILAASVWVRDDQDILRTEFPKWAGKTGQALEVFTTFIGDKFYGPANSDYISVVKAVCAGLQNQAKKESYNPFYVQYMMSKISVILEGLDNGRAVQAGKQNTDMPKSLLSASADLYSDLICDPGGKQFCEDLVLTCINVLGRPIDKKMIGHNISIRRNVKRALSAAVNGLVRQNHPISIPIINHFLKMHDDHVDLRDSNLSFSLKIRLRVPQLVAYPEGGASLFNVIVAQGNSTLLDTYKTLPALFSAADGKGDTPLHVSAKIGAPGITKKILAQGGNPNAQNKQGKTPLMYAIEKTQSTVVLLLSNITNWGIQDNEGNTALDYIVQGSNSELIAMALHQFSKPQVRVIVNENPRSMLLTAASTGNFTLVKKIHTDIFVHLDIRVTRDVAGAVLLAGIKTNRDSIVEFACETLKADPNFCMGDDSACILATKMGNLDTLKMLVKRNANPFAKGNIIKEAVSAKLSVWHISRLLSFLNSPTHSNTNKVWNLLHDEHPYSPLAIAAGFGADETVALLLNAGTRILQLARSPLQVAATKVFELTYEKLFKSYINNLQISNLPPQKIKDSLLSNCMISVNFQYDLLPGNDSVKLFSWDNIKEELTPENNRLVYDSFLMVRSKLVKRVQDHVKREKGTPDVVRRGLVRNGNHSIKSLARLFPTKACF